VVAGRARQGMFGVRGSGDTSGYGGLQLPAYVPPAAQRPYGGWFDEVTDELLARDRRAGGARCGHPAGHRDRGEITYYVRRGHLVTLCRTLRDDPALRFELCSSVSGVDYGTEVPQRLHAVYHLTSMTYRRRIRLEVAVDVDDPHVPSVVEVYPTADWQERETWDMYGIVFDGHPALTRILMPDDWDSHPQRRTTRSVGSRWSTREPRSLRRTSEGSTPDGSVAETESRRDLRCCLDQVARASSAKIVVSR
jgi:NADH-quinone oxidoreductase subunit C